MNIRINADGQIFLRQPKRLNIIHYDEDRGEYETNSILVDSHCNCSLHNKQENSSKLEYEVIKEDFFDIFSNIEKNNNNKLIEEFGNDRTKENAEDIQNTTSSKENNATDLARSTAPNLTEISKDNYNIDDDACESRSEKEKNRVIDISPEGNEEILNTDTLTPLQANNSTNKSSIEERKSSTDSRESVKENFDDNKLKRKFKEKLVCTKVTKSSESQPETLIPKFKRNNELQTHYKHISKEFTSTKSRFINETSVSNESAVLDGTDEIYLLNNEYDSNTTDETHNTGKLKTKSRKDTKHLEKDFIPIESDDDSSRHKRKAEKRRHMYENKIEERIKKKKRYSEINVTDIQDDLLEVTKNEDDVKTVKLKRKEHSNHSKKAMETLTDYDIHNADIQEHSIVLADSKNSELTMEGKSTIASEEFDVTYDSKRKKKKKSKKENVDNLIPKDICKKKHKKGFENTQDNPETSTLEISNKPSNRPTEDDSDNQNNTYCTSHKKLKKREPNTKPEIDFEKNQDNAEVFRLVNRKNKICEKSEKEEIHINRLSTTPKQQKSKEKEPKAKLEQRSLKITEGHTIESRKRKTKPVPEIPEKYAEFLQQFLVTTSQEDLIKTKSKLEPINTSQMNSMDALTCLKKKSSVHTNKKKCAILTNTNLKHYKIKVEPSAHKNTKLCKFCNETVKSGTGFDLHENSCKMNNAYKEYVEKLRNEMNENVFICDICSLTFSRRISLIKHLRSHNMRPNKDDTCDDSLKNRKTYIPQACHLYECNECHTFYKSQINLSKHKKIEHNPKTKTCKFCDETLKSSKIFNSHQKTCKMNFVYKVYIDKLKKGMYANVYICDICSFKFSHRMSIKRHIQSHKMQSKKFHYTCDYCKMIFYYKCKLQHHIHSLHSSASQGNDTKTTRKQRKEKKYRNKKSEIYFSCRLCNENKHPENKRKTKLLREHLYECNECDTFLKSTTELSKHKKSKHNKTTKTCKFCNGTLKYTKGFNVHLNSCKGYDKYKEHVEKLKSGMYANVYICDICSFKFSYRVSLIKHLQSHTSNMRQNKISVRYTCDYCKINFAQKKYLQLHINSVHMNDKVSQRDSQQNKILITSKNRPFRTINIISGKDFPCRSCDAEFDSKEEISEHYNKEHSPNLKCKYCNLTFIKLFYLERHQIYMCKKKEQRMKKELQIKKKTERILKKETKRIVKKKTERIVRKKTERKVKTNTERKVKKKTERIVKKVTERKVKKKTERKVKNKTEILAKKKTERKIKAKTEREKSQVETRRKGPRMRISKKASLIRDSKANVGPLIPFLRTVVSSIVDSKETESKVNKKPERKVKNNTKRKLKPKTERKKSQVEMRRKGPRMRISKKASLVRDSKANIGPLIPFLRTVVSNIVDFNNF